MKFKTTLLSLELESLEATDLECELNTLFYGVGLGGSKENIESFPCGSAGVKACRILQHKANNYIHMSKIAEWDTAAPDCILQSWGQGFIDIDGNALIYNKEIFYHKHFFSR